MKSWLVPFSAVMVFGASATSFAGGSGKAPRTAKHPLQRAAKRATKPKAPKGVVSPNAVRTNKANEIEFGAPIKFHNISIVPVLTKRTGSFRQYTLLEKGLKNKSFRVRELKGNSGEARVNAVEVRNTGNESVYLLGGEMILGGKQDRIIAQDTVVPDTGKWTKVEVFCVEEGRWQGQNMRFSSGKAIADISVRRAAMSGKQAAVWSSVAAKNVLHGTQSSTQTYRRTIQNRKLRKKIRPYVKELKSRLPEGERLAGVVFGINGKIHVADIFGNPVLYRDLSDKLLSAYVLEALGHQINRKARPVSTKAAKGFVGKGRKAKVKRYKKAGGARNASKETPELIGTETADDSGETIREAYIGK